MKAITQDSFGILSAVYAVLVLIGIFVPIANFLGMESIAIINHANIWVWIVLINALVLVGVHFSDAARKFRKFSGLIAGGLSLLVIIGGVYQWMQNADNLWAFGQMNGFDAGMLPIGETIEIVIALLQPNWFVVASIVVALVLGLVIGVQALRIKN